MRALAIILLAATANVAHADELTAAEVAGAPTPGDESGLVESVDPGDSVARRIARGVLFVPRVALDVAFFPIKLGATGLERYQVIERAKRFFFNDAMTFGVFPTIERQSGFGLTFGAKLVHRDVLGAGEKVSAQSAAGGRYQQHHRVALKSGDRFGDVLALELEAEYERRPGEPFHGIGNHDDIRARYRHQIARATAMADIALVGPLHVRASGELADHEIDGTDEMDSITAIYPTVAMAAADGSRDLYGELELRYDTRRQVSKWEPPATPGAGTLAAVFAGRSHDLGGGPDHWRYGVDLAHYIRLDVGPRLLVLRAHVEGVTNADRLPFYQLPRLGGTTYLRGYAAEQFRDQIAAVGSADYQWELARNFAARVFVDVGRVYAGTHDVRVGDPHVGYGVGIDVHTESSFLARASVASSIDGGVLFNFALDPAFELDRRIER
jgi:outer membrane protein assembly factor BamA